MEEISSRQKHSQLVTKKLTGEGLTGQEKRRFDRQDANQHLKAWDRTKSKREWFKNDTIDAIDDLLALKLQDEPQSTTSEVDRKKALFLKSFSMTEDEAKAMFESK